MPVFTFSGKSATGEKVSGERTAASKEALVAQLRRERIVPGPVRQKGKEFSLPTFGSGKVGTKDIAVFFRQFSVMIDAGLPLVQCLEILAANQENPTFQKTLTGVRTTVEGGATLANAMRQYPTVFDDLTTNMIEAGETGGILDIILQRLAIYVEKAVKLRAAIKSALIYPVSVVSLAFLIVGALLLGLVPPPDEEEDDPPPGVVAPVGRAESQLATRTMPPARPASRRMVERFMLVIPGDDRS